MQKPEAPTRRGFLDWLIAGCSFIAAAAMAIPGLFYLWPAAKGEATGSVEVDGVADMKTGDSKLIQLGSEAVIVVRGRSGFRAFSAVCTHLGCLVKWDGAQKKFLCPCHAAVFDENGGVISGPPPAPMPEYTVKQVSEKMFVSKV